MTVSKTSLQFRRHTLMYIMVKKIWSCAILRKGQ